VPALNVDNGIVDEDIFDKCNILNEYFASQSYVDDKNA
jgi:hypothetical protein